MLMVSAQWPERPAEHMTLPLEKLLADKVLFYATILIIPVAPAWRTVPKLHTVLVPPVVAVGLTFTPEPAGQGHTSLIENIHCSILGLMMSTLPTVLILDIMRCEFSFLRCGHLCTIHPFPVPFYSFIRQSNPSFFFTSIQAIDEGLHEERQKIH